MATTYVYQIVAGSVGDWNVIKNNHFIDVGTGCHGYRQADLSIPSTCQKLGLSPMVMSGNDSISNCNGEDPNTVGAYLASIGMMAVGGESTSQAEAETLENHLPFETFGGSYGEGDLDPFLDYRLGANKKSNMLAYLEPYTNYNMYVQETINVCVKAWDLGCKEVGVLVAQNKGGLQDYIDIANGVIAARGKFSGFCFWNGCIYNCSDTINYMSSIVQGLQARFPPTNVVMSQRLKGGVGPTPPSPKPPELPIGAIADILME